MKIKRHTGTDWADFDYRRLDYYIQQHHERYKAYVKARPHKLVCQNCGGGGGHVEIVLEDEGTGPWESCGWCEGTGLLTPHLRGEWLRMQKALKRDYRTVFPVFPI